MIGYFRKIVSVRDVSTLLKLLGIFPVIVTITVNEIVTVVVR